MSEREVDKTPPHDCGFHRGEGASCAFHEKWNQRGVPHPDGGAPPEPSEEAIAVARAILAKGRHPNWVPMALRAAYAVDFVRAASRLEPHDLNCTCEVCMDEAFGPLPHPEGD